MGRVESAGVVCIGAKPFAYHGEKINRQTVRMASGKFARRTGPVIF